MHVLTASEAGDGVAVSLYGGEENACGTVRFTVEDAKERRQMLATLLTWAADAEAVELVELGEMIKLRRL